MMAAIKDVEFHVAQFNNQSIPIIQYARENNLDYECFRQKLRRVRNASKKASKLDNNSSRFLPVQIKDSETPLIEIKVNDVSALVSENFNPSHLKNLISILKEC
jgi:hypothetical protein